MALQNATYVTLFMVVQGEWGPFRPNFPVEVPLWLALALQKKKCCRIQIPAWMGVGHLEGEQHVQLRCSHGQKM